VERGQATLRELAGVLGLRLQEREASGGAEPFIDLLMQLRNDLRAAKQFQLADSVRDRLADLGITLEDSAEGTRWRRRD